MGRIILSTAACLILQTFSHYLINATIKKKSYLTQNVFLFFSATYVWEISYSKKNWEKYDHKYTLVFM
jgi:hypothetical protein